ncbi:MAG: hypothetical protein KDB82_12725, partial [Planctomycetes bacterium]|nr:hypothetical protein [Planctomycetota bacterium]
KWFDQWIFGKGYPSLKASFSFDAKKGEGTFEIEQKQADKKKGVKLFEFITDIGWVIDGKLHTREVRIEKDKHSFSVKMDKEPEQVRLDPAVRTVCKIDFNPGDEKLRKQLTDAEDVVGRILAARELCKTGKRKNIEAVREAYRREKFWGVRIRMAGALMTTNSEVASEALNELLGVEQDGMVLETLVRCAGHFRGPKVREALGRFIEGDVQVYRARAAVWEVLGAQRNEMPLDKLLAAAGKDTPLGWEQAGAFRGLAETRRSEALQPLLDASSYGKTGQRARHWAAASIGALAKYLEKADREKAVERLVDLLRDPTPRVQKFAMMGLQSAGATEAVGQLESWGRGLSEQEQTGVARAAAGIRAGAKPQLAGVDKQLEEFRETVRKLNDRLEKLETQLEKSEN